MLKHINLSSPWK